MTLTLSNYLVGQKSMLGILLRLLVTEERLFLFNNLLLKLIRL